MVITITVKGPLLTEKHVEDLMKSMKNDSEGMMKEIQEFRKLAQDNVEDIKTSMENDSERMAKEI